jgi:hypothetical protein
VIGLGTRAIDLKNNLPRFLHMGVQTLATTYIGFAQKLLYLKKLVAIEVIL